MVIILIKKHQCVNDTFIKNKLFLHKPISYLIPKNIQKKNRKVTQNKTIQKNIIVPADFKLTSQSSTTTLWFVPVLV